MEVKRIGIDLAKNVFDVQGVDAEEKLAVRQTQRRGMVLEYFVQLPPCMVGMEACGGADNWARELIKLGHDARLMAPQFVTPYRKNNNTDRDDAQAICEAVGRPSMRLVPVKDEEQQELAVGSKLQIAAFILRRIYLWKEVRGTRGIPSTAPSGNLGDSITL